MIRAYMKVLRTIQSAEYKHFENGSVMNLISNFGNMYNKKDEYRQLMLVYERKLSLIKES
jgi:hypothetical protein